MANIKIEIDEKYREMLDLLKQVIPNTDGTQITDDGKIVEVLIDSFSSLIQSEGCCCGENCECENGGHCGEDCECEKKSHNK